MKIEKPVKILHTGDIQIEVRNVHKRYAEFESLFKQLKNMIIDNDIELYIIAGDIFEHCKPNDTERLLFINHLKNVLESNTKLKEIVIIDGNHDIDQKKTTNYYINNTDILQTPNSLTTICESVNDSRLVYYELSGLYNSPNIDGLSYIVWGQKNKHSSLHLYGGDTVTYKPEVDVNDIQDITCITLFHDPIYNCKNWDGSILRGNENFITLDSFTTPTIIAGDIHIPQKVVSENKQLIYCSSPVPRNFGEGDYIKNNELINNNSKNHSVHICTLNENGEIIESEYKEIVQYRTYTTFIIDPPTNIDTVYDFIDTLDFNIFTYGTYENMVRVKLPNANESWLELEPYIINKIRNTNNDISNTIHISFQYGKAIDIVDDTLLNSSNIDRLLSDTEIIKISDEYITKQVMLSRSIPKEDKELVIKDIKDIFINEIKNYISDIPSNNIKINDIHIDNFMAFGDNIRVNFDSVDEIIKLTGGNGVGKTTLYKAIKYLLTGFLSSSQNKRNKHDNNLLVFNDYKYNNDIVRLEAYINVNGMNFNIKRSVERTWKKNTTDEQKQSKKWKDYVQQCITKLSIVNEDNEGYINEEAEKILTTLFGDIENLERIVFCDQFSLRSFVCSEPSKLREEILNHIGMNFFEKMLSRYDSIRSQTLANLPKPAESIDVLNNQLTEYIINIDSYKKISSNLEYDINNISSEIESKTHAVNKLRDEKYPDVPDLHIINKRIDDNTTKINLTKEKIEKEKKNVSDINEKIQIEYPDIDLYDQKINEVTDNIEKENSIIKDLNTKISENKVAIEQSKNKILVRKNELSLNYNNQKNDLNLSIQNKETIIKSYRKDIYEIKEKKNNFISDKKLEITNLINDKKSLISTDNNSIKSFKYDIKLLNEKIEKHSSDTCPTCKQSLPSNVIDILNENKLKYRNDILDYESKINKCNENISTLLNDIEKLENECNNINDMVDIIKYNNIIDEYEHIIENNEKIIEDNKLQISNIDTLLINAIKTDDDIMQLVSDIKHMQEMCIKFEDDINTSNENIKSYNKLKTSYNESKQSYETLQNKVAEINEIIASYNNDIIECEQDIEKNKLDIKKSKINDNLELTIVGIYAEQSELQTELANLNRENINNTSNISVTEFNIRTTNESIQNAINYRIAESVLKQYKTLISKNGLPQYIFTIIKNVINESLNDLLLELNFRLLFDDNNNLVMLDLSKPSKPIRYPHQFSGMQICFAGLSLVYVSRLCNNIFKFDNIFIDEVSGQLNNGNELTYESLNYQEQLTKLLSKFKNLKVWIVDHVIDDLGEKHIYEAIPSNDGALLTKLK